MLKPHYTWNILDPSKLTTYCACPRQFFYRYVLGWSSGQPSSHLVFGGAMHEAMACLRGMLAAGDCVRDVCDASRTAFMTHYRKVFESDTDELYEPKTPEHACEAIWEYLKKYCDQDKNERIYHIERPGVVSLEKDVELHFRMDLILHDPVLGYLWRDYKTKTYGPTTQWRNQFQLSLQAGAYTHCLYCLYDPEEVYGGQIDGIFFSKTKLEFERIPVRIQPPGLEVWWNTVRYHIGQLHQDYEKLADTKESDETMEAFPLRPTACSSYFGCQFHPYCVAWPNPLRRCQQPPVDMVVKYWDPAAREETTT